MGRSGFIEEKNKITKIEAVVAGTMKVRSLLDAGRFSLALALSLVICFHYRQLEK